jgi:hypothetical protein
VKRRTTAATQPHASQALDAGSSTGAGVVAQDTTGIQRFVPGLHDLRLVQDALDPLSQGGRVVPRRQRALHIGKGAIPAFLQCLLGDDHPLLKRLQFGGEGDADRMDELLTGPCQNSWRWLSISMRKRSSRTSCSQTTSTR